MTHFKDNLRRSDGIRMRSIGSPGPLDRCRHLCYKTCGDVSGNWDKDGYIRANRSQLKQTDIRNGEDRGWNC